MAQKRSDSPTADDIETQINTIRNDVATLTALLKDLASQKVDEVRKTALDEAEDLLKRSHEAADEATAKAKTAAGSVEGYISEKPVQATLIALLVGFVIGSLSRR
jgi:ElaB/YqjD/DUF883 family membrane-anchored ribosome-binding protein